MKSLKIEKIQLEKEIKELKESNVKLQKEYFELKSVNEFPDNIESLKNE